jgi:hypothetical protein
MAKKLLIEDNQEIPAIVYQEDTIEGYTDCTDDMLSWDSSIHILDWSRRRDNIAVAFYSIASSNLSTYGNLTAPQKLIGAKYFLVPYSLRVTNGIVTEDEDLINWAYLLEQTKISRKDCVEAMRKHVGQYIRVGTLTLAHTQLFFKDVVDYINWFEQSNAPDFKQWITNEVGSAYENAGFAETSYYNATLKDELLDIYNGNY